MTLPPPSWDDRIDPLELAVSVWCGGGRCRIEVREYEANTHLVTADVSATPSREAFRQAALMVVNRLTELQREAGR